MISDLIYVLYRWSMDFFVRESREHTLPRDPIYILEGFLEGLLTLK